MDFFLIPIFILACPLLLFLFLALLFYLIPVRFAISIVRQEDRQESSITVSWGLIGIRTFDAGDGPRIDIMVMERVVYSTAGPADRPIGEEAGTPLTADLLHFDGIVHFLQQYTGPLGKLGSVLYRQSRFQDARGRVFIGLGDTVATGILYGGYWASRFILEASRIFIDVKPVFGREILDLDLVVRLRIDHPLLIMIATLRLLKKPIIWQTITFARKGSSGIAGS